MPGTVPPLIPLKAKHDDCHTLKFLGLGLIHSPSTHLDPALTNCWSTKEQGLHAIGPRVFSPSHPLRHHGAQGWPAIPGARHYSSFHNARQNFTSKAPPRRLCLLLALLMQKWICKHKGLIPKIDIQSVPVDLTC
jgi:hypothetical protein